jgi:hypothetical protein
MLNIEHGLLGFLWRPNLGGNSKVSHKWWASCIDMGLVGIVGAPTRALIIEEGPHLALHLHYSKA